MGVLTYHTHIIRARDQERIAAFWQALGFHPHRRGANVISFYGSDNPNVTILEIARIENGPPVPGPVTSRSQVAAMGTFDTDDLDAVVAAAAANGGTVLDVLEYPDVRARLIYVADPEWNILGFRQLNVDPRP